MLWHFGKALTHLDSSALWKVKDKVAKEIARVMATDDVKKTSTPAPYKKTSQWRNVEPKTLWDALLWDALL